MSIKLEFPSNVDTFNTSALTSTDVTATNATISGVFTLDGYVINPSGATNGQVLKYNGSSFVAGTVLSSIGIGTSISSGTTKSILYVDGSSNLAQDNSNFAWDFTNHRLGIGNNSPSYPLHVVGDGYLTSRFIVNASSAAVSPSGTGSIRYNTSTNHLEFSENGGAYTAFGTGSGSSIGGAVTGGTAKSVLYIDGSGNLAQDNSNFTWDGTNHYLGLGIGTPLYGLDLHTASDVSAFHLRTGSSNDDGLYMNSGAAGGATVSVGAKNTGGGTWQARATNAEFIDLQSTGIGFYTDNSLTIGGNFTPTRKVLIDMSGNVLVGTSTAASGKLQVETQDSNHGQLQIANTATNSQASMTFISGATAIGTSPTSTNGTDHVWEIGAGIYSIGGAKFGFATDASAASFVTLDGTNSRLGLGLSNTSPGTTLDIGNTGTTASMAMRAGSSSAVSSANTGRLRYNESTQHFEISENTGAYTQLSAGGGGMSIGGAVTSGTTGSILYVASGPVLAQDNSNFFWDATNHRLGIGVNSSLVAPLEIKRGDTDIIKITNTSASSYADTIWYDSSNTLKGGIGYGNASATFRTSKNFILTLTDFTITDDTTNFYTLTKTTGQHAFTQPINTTGSPNLFQITGAAHTTLSNAETIDGYFKLDRTVQFGQNTTLGTQRAVYISAPTYSSSAATKTITTAATFAISGPPIQGTNTTLTGTYPMWVQSGIARFDGQILAGPAAASTINNATVAAKFVSNVSGAGVMYLQNIHSSGVSQLELYDNNNSFHSAYGYANAGGGSYIFNQSGDAFSIQQNGNHALHIDSSSRVGINLSSSLANNFGVNGNAVIGNSYTNTAAPSNGLLVQGVTVIGATSATAAQNLEVRNANGNGVGGQFAMRNTNSVGQGEFDVFDHNGTFRLSEGFDNNSVGGNPTAYYYTGASTDFLQQTNNGANLTCYRSDGAWTFNANSHSGATNTAATQHLATFFKDYTYPGDTTGSQIAVAGKTDPTKIMAIGMDTNTTNGFGYIQAAKQGTANTYVALQPAGGTVTIGATTATTPLAFLFVGTSSSDGVGTIKNTSTTGYSNIRYEKSDGTFEGSFGFANASAGITHLQSKMHLYSGGPNYVFANATAVEIEVGCTNTQAFIEWNAGASAAVSASSRGRIRYNGSTQFFQSSVNGVAYVNMLQGALTTTRVPFASSAGVLTDDSALVWDNTNKSLGIGIAPSTNTLSVFKNISGGSIVAIQNGNTAGYSSIIFNDSSTVQKGSIGYANASTGGSIQGLNYLYSPSIDWVISDATTNWFRFYTTTGSVGLELSNGSSGAVSTSNTGRIRYNSTSQQFEQSVNAGSYDIIGSNIVQAAATTGSPTAFKLTGGAHTTLTASVEAIDGYYKLDRSVQFNTGALTTQRAMYISAPTYRFVGASTITNAATLAIGNAPQAGTNATITNAYALWIQAGKAKFAGDVVADTDVVVQAFLAAGVGSNLTSGTTITPTNLIHHVTGTNNISTITAPTNYTSSGKGGVLYIIPDDAFTWDTGGNIAVGGTAITNRMITLIYDNGTSKWYPSYV